jgi:tRNA (mo5U34)-methyltransferase
MNALALRSVKDRTWFYEFELPDGSHTQSDLPAHVLGIHTSRRDKLRRIIEHRVGALERISAIDFASHEGYFSIELAKYFRNVIGFEFREESVAAARLIAEALGVENVTFSQADLQLVPPNITLDAADFVLVYGLLYHLENPIHLLRLASRLCSKHILVESQVSTFETSGRIEGGHYLRSRRIEGNFFLVDDFPHHREGGSAEFALIPSTNAILFLLRRFGFEHVEVLPPDDGDYEQFARFSRVLIYGCKP